MLVASVDHTSEAVELVRAVVHTLLSVYSITLLASAPNAVSSIDGVGHSDASGRNEMLHDAHDVGRKLRV